MPMLVLYIPHEILLYIGLEKYILGIDTNNEAGGALKVYGTEHCVIYTFDYVCACGPFILFFFKVRKQDVKLSCKKEIDRFLAEKHVFPNYTVCCYVIKHLAHVMKWHAYERNARILNLICFGSWIFIYIGFDYVFSFVVSRFFFKASVDQEVIFHDIKLAANIDSVI